MVQRKQYGKMNRKQTLEESGSLPFFEEIIRLHGHLDDAFHQQFNRSLPFADEVLDRWERAKKLKFGEGSSIYDSSYVFGEVVVGKNTWIGPFTIIDGSGGLEIGDNCTISSGVHIYTHDNVAQTLTGGKAPIEREKVVIGNCTYIGPNTIIRKGLSIGNFCIIGVGSFVNDHLPSHSIAVGSPARIIGKTIIKDDKLTIEYFHKKD
jgi:acetyltransferase-like isoleucine patch superfamily enzyme